MIDFWENVSSELRSDRKVFVAFVADCSKGSPGTPKARMMVRFDGSQFGTIGGGIMEKSLLQNALKALRLDSFEPRLQRISHQAHAKNPSGLICGGSQSNALAVLTPSRDSDPVRLIVDALKSEQDVLIELTPAGLALRPQHTPVPSGSRLKTDGDTWAYQLSTTNLRRIVIFGAGHCGQALAIQMKLLGYHVTLCDTRKNLQISERIRSETTFLSSSPLGACLSIQHWNHTSVVVMTHSYPTDLDALQEVLPYGPSFLGLMGSPPKLLKIRKELAERSFTHAQIASIRAPVGLAIGSDTPEEIAVSIAAQLLQEQNLNTIHEPDYSNHVSA